MIPAPPAERSCICASALEGAAFRTSQSHLAVRSESEAGASL